MLRELGIVAGDETKACKIFENLFPNFFEVDYRFPSDYVKIYWEKYISLKNGNANLNGKIFEYILATLCIRENFLPFYMNARVAFVPNVNYDLMFHTYERGPICWSIKTSLRERYKQADLESFALKNVHRRALSYLVTLEENEAAGIKQKIASGDIIGLDNVFVAVKPEFDEFISEFKKFRFEEPPLVRVFRSNLEVTGERLKLLKSQSWM